MPNWISMPPRIGAHAGAIRLTVRVTPPSPMGTAIGGHIYVEDPDQSSTPAAFMDGTTLMDGSATQQGQWNPIDCGKLPYVASQQPWIVEFGSGVNRRTPHDVRVYVAPYSDQIDTPLVRYGLAGATPSYVVTVPAETVSYKPASGSNVTPYLVTGITGAVSAAVSISGKLKRPIGITVDLSGLPALPPHWGYQLLGFQDGDTTQNPVLASGIITDTTGGLIPAGPDGISTPHTFGPEEPTAITNITVYAVAGLVASDRYVAGAAPHTPGAFVPNNIVPGITASCQISIGTTGGVIDAGALQGLTITTALLADGAVSSAKIADGAVLTAKIPDLGIITSKLAAYAVDSTKLAALAVLSGNLADSAVTAAKIANLAVGTAAIALLAVGNAQIGAAAVTNAKIGNLAVSTAQIQDLAITTAKIGLLQVTAALIADATITTAKIGLLQVTAAQIADATITTAKIGLLAVGTAQIADAAITAAKIGTLTVANISGWDGASINVGSGGLTFRDALGQISTVKGTEVSTNTVTSVYVYSSQYNVTAIGGNGFWGTLPAGARAVVMGGIVTGYV